MKNPFKKEDNNSALIAFVAIGAIAAGAITYLYLKKRSALKAATNEVKEHATDYLKPHHLKKKRTTDLHDLGKIAG
ncbi:hypothetical protein [Mucilaginibacter jinjuensis]|uniref:LPXTG-motif cell wall-anchored protein n=1 Tax=Mucilaginibacter jinjuensis TaxID=1176721 RepID=A0ABY7TEV2_9SPHI|nr:hypothetical protein [Mucilaginibacter jinjuensis]WCT14898.1 hypothetical protein PQO05_13225 [Mucilaginibacter jinjuensis]